MFFGDSLTTAMEELWQLALTMASLKYIMGTVTEEVTAAFTGLEEDESLSHFDKKKASPEPHCSETPETDRTEEEDPHISKSFISSMATHSLPQVDNSIATSDSNTCISLSSHMSYLPSEPEENDASSITSLMAHQVQLDEEESPTEDDNDFQTYLFHLSDLEIQDSDQSILTSMVCHQSSSLCLSEEPEDHSQSMVAHKQHQLDLEDIEQTSLSSMVSHQTLTVETALGSIHNIFNQTAYVDIVEGLHEGENTNFSSERIKEKEIKMLPEINLEKIHIETKKQTEDTEDFGTETSFTVHQLSNIDVPWDYHVSPLSMNAHQHNLLDMEDSSSLSSMVAHHIGIIGVSSIDYNDDILHYYMYFDYTEGEETTECTSSVSHQLPSSDTQTEFKEFLSSMSAHSYQAPEIEDADTACLSSMVAHQILEFGTTKLNENTDLEYAISLVENLGEETSECASMVSHQLPFSETPSEFKEIVLSMVSHEYQQSEANDSDTASLSSMEAHQQQELDNSEAEEIYDLHEYTSVCDTVDEETTACISAVSHQLPHSDAPAEFREFLSSISAHSYQAPEIEDEDTACLSSMVAHHISDLGKIHVDENTDLQYAICLVDNLEEETPELATIVSPQLLSSDTPSEFKEFSLPIISHECQPLEANDLDTALLSSMEAHQKSELDNLEAEEIYDLHEYTSVFDTDDEETTACTSAVCHQLPSSDAPSEFREFLSSMSAHSYQAPEIEDSDTACLSSMLAHQIPELGTTKMDENTDLQYALSFVDNLEEEIPECASIVSHQLPSSDTPSEFKEFLSSMSAHSYQAPEIEESDTAYLSSMAAHQIPDLGKTQMDENTDFVDNLGEETPELASIVSHQLQSSDTLSEFQDFALSMVSHVCQELEVKDSDTASLSSMEALQKQELDNSEAEEICDLHEYISVCDTVDEETSECISTVSHKLSSMDVPDVHRDHITSMASHHHNLSAYTEDSNTMVAHQYHSEELLGIEVMADQHEYYSFLYNEEEDFMASMVAHQLPTVDVIDNDPPDFISTMVTHFHLPQSLEDLDTPSLPSMTVHQLNLPADEDKNIVEYLKNQITEEENLFVNISEEEKFEAVADMNSSKINHQLYTQDDNILKVSYMNNNEEVKNPPHQQNKKEEHMPNHELSTRQCKVVNEMETFNADLEDSKETEELEESGEEIFLNDPRKIKPGIISDTIKDFVHTEQNNGVNSYTNNIESTDIAIENEADETYLMRIKRIKDLQQIVDDEIGNFKCRDYKNKNQETVSTSNVTNVNGIEFPVAINLNNFDLINADKEPKLNKEIHVNEELLDPIKEIECGQLEEDLSHETRSESFARVESSLNVSSEDELQKHNQNECNQQTIINTENKLETELKEDEFNNDKYIEYEEDLDNDDHQDGPEENVVTASCILGDNEPVVIKSSAFSSDKDSEKIIYKGNETDDEKLVKVSSQPETQGTSLKASEKVLDHQTIISQRMTKSRCVNQDIKTREKELLHSFLNITEENEVKPSQTTQRENWKNTVDIVSKEENNTVLEQTKSQSKSSLTSNIGEHLKKRTFKIKFKVRIGKETHSHSKHSVLQYLFGCFGGQKLFKSLPE